jgi:hypothetical protein
MNMRSIREDAMANALPLLTEDDDELEETLDDMEPEERAALEACLERALEDVERGDRSGWVPAEELLRELQSRR